MGAKADPSGCADAEGFADLYRRWWPDVVALCNRLLGTCDAEDGAQEAFLRAWLAWDQYSPSQPFRPWVLTIARRVCLDRLRQGARQPVEHGALDVEVVEITPERVVVAAADLKIVFEAIDDLHGRDRRALLLREFGGWSYRQIAAVEGTTVEAVRGALKRTRATLRRSVLHDDVFGVGLRASDEDAYAAPRRSGGMLSAG